MTTAAEAPGSATAFDPTDPDVMRERVPHEELLALRRTAPVSFVEQTETARAGFPDHRGYWAVSKHADVAAISKDQANFSTNLDGVIIRFGPDMDREGVENTKFLLINHDAPDHTKLRQIVSRAFTPRAIAALHEDLERRSREIVAEAVAKGEGNFVEDVAAELPLQAIAGLLGVPQEDRGKLFEWSNQMMSYDDPEVEGDEAVAFMEILGYSMALADERRKNPQDDIITKLVSAEIDASGEQGRGLTDDEFGFFMVLLAVAGNETTRNAISHGMHAFFQNPDQWELYKRDPAGDRGRRDHPLGHPGHGLPAHRDQRRRGRRRAGRRRASGSGSSTPAPTSTRTSSPTRSASTSPATPTRTRPSVATGRTTASAPTWPGSRST